jgi:titin
VLERNVISGNDERGVFIHGAGVDQNIVAGNYIGTNAAGDAVLPNGNNGIAIW